MDKLALSVIIPTYNRKETLAKCLRALFNQSCSKLNYEIIVVDDGSTHRTLEMLKEIIVPTPIVLRYFRQEKSGPAAARNLGLKHAKGKYLVFIGDDIIASKNLLQEHLQVHCSQNDVAVLGYTLWDRDLLHTEFMKFLNYSGKLFGYHKIKDKNDCGFEFFFTCNISLEKKWFIQDKFDEDFTYPAQEDIEISYRLKRRGLRIVFNQRAIAYHCHQYDENLFLQRTEMMAQAISVLWEKHPELKKITGPKRVFLSRLAIKLLPLVDPFFKIRKLKYIYWRAQITDHLTKRVSQRTNR